MADLLRTAAPTDMAMDVQITSCGEAMPLRGGIDALGSKRRISGYRGAYSPDGGDTEYEEWTFESAAALADRLYSESVEWILPRFG